MNHHANTGRPDNKVSIGVRPLAEDRTWALT